MNSCRIPFPAGSSAPSKGGGALFASIHRALFFVVLAGLLAIPVEARARIEVMLMGQTKGVKPPPLSGERRLRGTPFGHMALYIESATRDEEKIIRQAEEGEPAGLVLTVDKQLKNAFFIANPRNEFFYGDIDPEDLPGIVTREDLEKALARFDEKYGHFYRKGPGVSGFGQDYGVLYLRRVWGLVYPTTREEEAKIIDYWQRHRKDTFTRTTNNCVSTITRSLMNAGLTDRKHFFRGYACYNAWVYWLRSFITAGEDAKTPGGNYLRRDGTFVTEYLQLSSDAIIPSGRPFNAWSFLNMEYLIWIAPRGSLPITGEVPVDYGRYPTGREPASWSYRRGFLARQLVWPLSQAYEFARLWPQTFAGIWWLVTK